MKTEEKSLLLEEARRRFPKGTKFTNTNIKEWVKETLISGGNPSWSGGSGIVVGCPKMSFSIYCPEKKEWAILIEQQIDYQIY